jgi:hypothetical protein
MARRRREPRCRFAQGREQPRLGLTGLREWAQQWIRLNTNGAIRLRNKYLFENCTNNSPLGQILYIFPSKGQQLICSAGA